MVNLTNQRPVSASHLLVISENACECRDTFVYGMMLNNFFKQYSSDAFYFILSGHILAL